MLDTFNQDLLTTTHDAPAPAAVNCLPVPPLDWPADLFSDPPDAVATPEKAARPDQPTRLMFQGNDPIPGNPPTTSRA